MGDNYYLPELESDTFETGDLSSGDGADISHSVSVGLSQGFVVGYAAGATPTPLRFRKPSDAASDSTAIQDVVNWINSQNDPAAGELHIPARKDDGNLWDVSSQIVIGSDSIESHISTYFHGFDRLRNPFRSSITDGSFPFFIDGGPSGTTAGIRGIEFHGLAFDGQGNDTGILKTRRCLGADIRINWANSFTGTGVQLGASSFECYLRAVLDPNDSQSTPTAIPVEVAGGGDSHLHVYSPTGGKAKVIDVSGANESVTNVFIKGRIEGAEGDSNIHARSGNVVVAPGTRVGQTSSGAHGIHVDGANGAILSPALMASIDGDAINVGSSFNRVRIADEITFSGIVGDAINYSTEPGPGDSERLAVVPREKAIRGQSVTYPPGAWKVTKYPDGWAKGKSGQVTLSGGAGTGTSNAATATENITGTENADVELNIHRQQLDADYSVESKVVADWDDSQGLTETTVLVWWSSDGKFGDPGGGNDLTVDYEVYYRDDQP